MLKNACCVQYVLHALYSNINYGLNHVGIWGQIFDNNENVRIRLYNEITLVRFSSKIVNYQFSWHFHFTSR